MAENKTLPTDADVDAFLAAVPDAVRRVDALRVRALIERVSGEPARMWGGSIVGCGSYHYRYESDREGYMARVSFSPRKGQTVLYIADGFPQHAELLARLGKHSTGVSCLYVKKLADIDEGVLEELIRASLAAMAQRYPAALA